MSQFNQQMREILNQIRQEVGEATYKEAIARPDEPGQLAQIARLVAAGLALVPEDRARPRHPMPPQTGSGTVEQVLEAIAEFRRVQDEHGDLGAEDTEPEEHFAFVVHDALFSAKSVDESLDEVGDWELFTREPGYEPAVAALTQAARAVYEAIRQVPGDLRPALYRGIYRVEESTQSCLSVLRLPR